MSDNTQDELLKSLRKLAESVKEVTFTLKNMKEAVNTAVEELMMIRVILDEAGIIPTDQSHKIVSYLNERYKRKFKKMTDAQRGNLNARLSEGFTIGGIKEVIDKAHREGFHVENGFKYLTPEYFTRRKTLEIYCNDIPLGRTIKDL